MVTKKYAKFDTCCYELKLRGRGITCMGCLHSRKEHVRAIGLRYRHQKHSPNLVGTKKRERGYHPYLPCMQHGISVDDLVPPPAHQPTYKAIEKNIRSDESWMQMPPSKVLLSNFCLCCRTIHQAENQSCTAVVVIPTFIRKGAKIMEGRWWESGDFTQETRFEGCWVSL